MKKLIKITVVFLLCFGFSLDASAFVIYIKFKGGDVCVSGGKDAGACSAKGFLFKGAETDYVIRVNGKITSSSKFQIKVIDKTSGGSSSKVSDVTMGELSYTKNDTEAKKSSSAKELSLNDVKQQIDLSKVFIENKKTGEKISLETIIKLYQSCN